MKWLNSKQAQLALTAVISAAAGAGVSFLVSAKIHEKQFNERLEKEILETKVHYQRMYSTPTFVAEEPTSSEGELLQLVREADEEIDAPPIDLVGQALDAVRNYQGDDEDEKSSDDRPTPEPTIVNVFQNHVAPGEEVLGALMKDRDPSEPYIITREEFDRNEPDFEQLRFTYWEGDDILVDVRDEMNPIQDTERIAGEDNLLRFGYGSGDVNVLYIRNETMDPPMDMHITRSNGKYSVEVMGFDDDEPFLKHSQPRKFRIRDE